MEHGNSVLTWVAVISGLFLGELEKLGAMKVVSALLVTLLYLLFFY